jgi:glutamate synthase domain-containing protein 2
VDISKAMVRTGIKPDFITIDGGEGGTGAAPIEFSNYMGMPMRDALAFAYNTLVGYDLKKDIKLDVSGKIVSGFAIAKALALGADLCNSARAMMLAVGCIQALQCNTNTCPTGVATQNPDLMVGLNVEDKAKRAASFHRNTMKSFLELIAAMGISKPEELNRSFVNRRVSADHVLKYNKIYPYVAVGAYLREDPVFN